MKILFVWPCVTFSVWDVARGYRAALGRLIGEDNIQDYYLDKHLAYHQKAIPKEHQNEIILSRYASETIITQALYFSADHVIIVSGLNLHPIALWGLKKIGIPVTTIMTESPYNDDSQTDWSDQYPGMTIITTERTSLRNHPEWACIPHAYDPAIHHPVSFEKELECDVFMVGSGWPERQALLEKIDWTGINLRLYGFWMNMTKKSPLYKFLQPMSLIDNTQLPRYYCSSKVNLNIHRGHPIAESLNPRAYEIAACGAYQICDARKEVSEVFADTVPMVKDAVELEYEIRWALANPKERLLRAIRSKELVHPHIFDSRARLLLSALGVETTENQRLDSLETTNV